MPVIINGSTGISGTDGSAGTPAVQGTDTNTGMFFPAADTIAFAEGGTEVIRIDSSGNVGIGTTSPANRLTIATAGYGDFGVRDTSVGQSAYLGIGGTVAYLGASGSTNLQIQTNGTTRATVTSAGLFQFDSGYGSVATAYGCRAWVNFNGTGTVAIRASGNVSSITDNGTGDYTVNFTTAMPDANYAVDGVGKRTGFNEPGTVVPLTYASGSIRIVTGSGSFTLTDSDNVNVAIFR